MDSPEPDPDALGDTADEAASDGDATGMMAVVRPRLGDYVAGEPELPHALLVVVAGAARGTVLSIDTLPIVIGRADDADVTVADETVSRRHARLSGDRDHISVEDLGSSNGTSINGNPLAGELGLVDGDIVGFGEAVVVVKLLR